jgi:protein ImuB
VAERLGPEGVRLRKLARGVPGIPIKPDIAPPSFAERMELEHPVDLLEPLSFILSRQLHALCDKLASYGLSALELHLELTLTPGPTPVHRRTIRLPVPMRNPITFLKLLQLDLDAHPPPAPIVAVAMRIEPSKPRAVQEGLFLPPSPEPEKLELTLQRIAALVGKENVGSPALVDTHRPGAFAVRPALEKSGRVLSIPPATLAFRAFRPAVPARVVSAADEPRQVWARAKSRVIEGRVLTVAGPWRTSGDWWTTTPWAREDWDLSLSDGALYRLYREYFTGAWFLDGEYD